MQGETQEVTIAANDIRETRGPAQQIGIRVVAQTKEIKLAQNRSAGLMKEVVVLSGEQQ
ncbi:MAG TPA: hypothetical protein VMP01_04035 [Pirellulaceae bacterium]|nr:hypothetical protein [Pirellulaceae bacterium]